MTTTTYSVIVRSPNSWSASTGSHEELANCGHNHKSFVTAQACYDRLTAWHDGSTSARWYHARIEDSTGHEIAPDGSQIPTDQERRAVEFGGLESE
jgi:hypothetical protein